MRQYECSLSEIFAEQQKTFEKPSDCPTGIKQQMQQLEQLFIALCHAVPLWATLSMNCQTLASLPCIIHCCLIQFWLTNQQPLLQWLVPTHLHWTPISFCHLAIIILPQLVPCDTKPPSSSSYHLCSKPHECQPQTYEPILSCILYDQIGFLPATPQAWPVAHTFHQQDPCTQSYYICLVCSQPHHTRHHSHCMMPQATIAPMATTPFLVWPALRHYNFRSGYFWPTNQDKSGHLWCLTTRHIMRVPQYSHWSYYMWSQPPPQYHTTYSPCVARPKSMTADKNLLQPP